MQFILKTFKKKKLEIDDSLKMAARRILLTKLEIERIMLDFNNLQRPIMISSCFISRFVTLIISLKYFIYNSDDFKSLNPYQEKRIAISIFNATLYCSRNEIKT